MSGDFRTRKARLLDPAFVPPTDAAERSQHLASDLGARAERRRLLQVDQDRSQHVVLAVDGDAADEIGRVLLLREPSRRLAARPAARQHVHGASPHARVPKRIRVNGDEQVRAVTPRNLGSAPQTDVVVAVANHHRPHARRAVDAALERAGDGQHDVLFPDARSGDGARIFAAVARIDGHDNLAPALRGVVRSPLGWRRLRCPAARRIHVDDQTVAILSIGLEQEALGSHPLLHVEHDPQVVSSSVAPPALGALALRGPDAFEETVTGTGARDAFREPGVANVDDDPIRVAQHEQCVLDGTLDVENDPGVVGCGPRPDVLDVDGGGVRRHRHQAHEADREDAHVHHLTGRPRKGL